MTTPTDGQGKRLLEALVSFLLAGVIAAMFADKSVRDPSGPDAAGFAIGVCYGVLYPAWSLMHRAGLVSARPWRGIVTILLLPPLWPWVLLLTGVPGRFGAAAGAIVGFLLAAALVSCIPKSVLASATPERRS